MRYIVLTVAFFAAVAIAIGSGTQSASAGSISVNPSALTSSYANGPSHQGPIGIPAIHPNNLSTMSIATPSFSRDDVINYILNIRPNIFHAQIEGKPVIGDIEFDTVQHVAAEFHREISLPQDQLVCLVVFDNKVKFNRDSNQGQIEAPRAFELFDAHSGYFLMSGSLGDK